MSEFLNLPIDPSREERGEYEPVGAARMTPREHQVVEVAALLWNQIVDLIGDGPAAAGDRTELAFHIHGIQRMVMAQAARRAWPWLYPPRWPEKPTPEGGNQA